MLDHVYLLIELGPLLPLGKAVARLKAKTSPLLRADGLKWQPGYFDHRLRPHENLLPYFIYTYLNPYRANLLPAEEKWPRFLGASQDRDWFLPMLNDYLPEPAWLTHLP
jgi:REP element-mobilizing transposase RayT